MMGARGGADDERSGRFDTTAFATMTQLVWNNGTVLQRVAWGMWGAAVALFCYWAFAQALLLLLASTLVVIVSEGLLYLVSDEWTRKYLVLATFLHVHSWFVLWVIYLAYGGANAAELRSLMLLLLAGMHATVFTASLIGARMHTALRPRHMMVDSRMGSGVY